MPRSHSGVFRRPSPRRPGFGRAEARDFADVYDLALRYGRERLLGLAAADDAGFDRHIFATMIASIDRPTDEDLSGPRDANELRAYFHDWATELADD